MGNKNDLLKRLEEENKQAKATVKNKSDKKLNQDFRKRAAENNKEIANERLYQTAMRATAGSKLGPADGVYYGDYQKLNDWRKEYDKMPLKEVESRYKNIRKPEYLKNAILSTAYGKEYLKENKNVSIEGFKSYLANRNMPDMDEKTMKSLNRAAKDDKAYDKDGIHKLKEAYTKYYLDNRKKNTDDLDDLNYIKGQYENSQNPDKAGEWKNKYKTRYDQAEEKNIENKANDFIKKSQLEGGREDRVIANIRDSYNSAVKNSTFFSTGWSDEDIEVQIKELERTRGLDRKTAERVIYKITSEEARKSENEAVDLPNAGSMGEKIGTSALSVGTNIIGSIPEALNMASQKIKNIFSDHEQPINRTNMFMGGTLAQKQRDSVTDTMDSELGKFLYGTGMSILDFATAAGLTGGLGAAASGEATIGSALMGQAMESGTLAQFSASSAANTFTEMKERGIDDNKAVMLAGIAGVAEAAFEKISLDRLIKGIDVDSVKSAVLNTLSQGLTEGSEEVATDVANAIAERFVLKDKSSFVEGYREYKQNGMSDTQAKIQVVKDFAKQIALSFAGGALSGGVMGAGASAAGYFNNRNNNNADLEEPALDVAENHAMETEGLEPDIMESGSNELNLGNEETNVDNIDTYNLGKDEIQDISDEELLEIAKSMEESGSNKESSEKVIVPQKKEAELQHNLIQEKSVRPESENKDKSKMKVPDAIKFEGEELKQSVETGKYHPQYSLNTMVETPKGKGYIQEIVSAGPDSRQVIVNYEDGSSSIETMHALNDIVDDPGESVLYSFAVDFGYNGANTFIKQAQNQNLQNFSAVNKYASHAHALYTAGINKTSFEDTYNNGISLVMPENMARELYNAGVYDRKNMDTINMFHSTQEKTKSQERYVSKGKEVKSENKNQNKGKITKAKDGSNVTFNGIEESALNEIQKAAVDVAKVVSKATGVNIEFFESRKDSRGNYVGENGSYLANRKQIRIDINAGMESENKGSNIMIVTLAHELTHYTETLAPGQHEKMKTFALEKLSEKTGTGVDELINEEKIRVQQSRKEHSMKPYNESRLREVAESELVARSYETMLTDKDAIVELAKMDKGLFGKIKARIMEFAGKIETACKELLDENGRFKNNTISFEARALQKEAQEMRKMWDKALKEAGENLKTIEANENKYVYSDRESFEKQVDKAVAGEWNNLNALYVSETPKLLLDMGLKQQPMLYTKKHLTNALKQRNDENHWHGLTVEQVKLLPEIVKHPAIVMDSLTRNDSIIIISDKFNNYEEPLIVSIKIDGEGIYELQSVKSNFITSMYGKGGIEEFVNNAVEKDAILYIDNKKSQNLFSLAKVQFPRSLNKYDFDTILCQSSHIVNKKNNKNIEELLRRRRHMPKGTTDDTLINNSTIKYIEPNKKRVTQALDVQAPRSNVRNALASPLENSISQKYENNNNIRYQLRENYKSDIDNWYNSTTKEQRVKDNGRFFIGTTSDVLKSINIKEMNFYFGKSKIQKILNKHKNMTIDLIKNVPEMLENPIIVMDSVTREDSLVVLGELYTDRGIPVMASVLIDPKNKDGLVEDFGIVSSSYAKENIERYQNIINKSTIRYIEPNKKRTNSWLSKLRLQLPSQITQYGSINKITSKDNFVNMKQESDTEDLLYSMRNISEDEYGPIIEENEVLKEQVRLLKEQFKVTNGHNPEMIDILKIGRKILKENNSTYDIKDFAHNMEEIVKATKDVKFQNYTEVMNAMIKTAREIAEQSTFKDDSEYNQYKELRKTLRETKITLNSKQKEAVADKYGSYNDFRKSTFGKLKLVNGGGVYLDEMWNQYAEMYPEVFNKEVTESDMVDELLDVMDRIKNPKFVKGSEIDIDSAAVDIAQQIFREYFALPSVQTFADARINDLKKAREEYNENIKAIRQTYRERQGKREYKDKIVRLRNNIAAKVTQKKEVPFEMVDTVIDILNEICKGQTNLGGAEVSTKKELIKAGLTEAEAKQITDKASKTFLDNVSEDTLRTERKFEKWLMEQEYNKIENRTIAYIVHDKFFSVAAVNKGEKSFHQKLKTLQERYAEFNTKGTAYEWKSEYNELLNGKLKEIVNITQDKAINSLNAYELEKLYNSLKEVSHVIIEARNQIREDGKVSNLEVGEKIIEEIEAIRTPMGLGKFAKKANVYAEKYLLNSKRYIKSITNYLEDSVLGGLYEELFNASRKEDKFVMDSKKPFDKLVENQKEYNKFIGKEKNSTIKDALTDKEGNFIEISHNQLVQILMSWERTQGKTHMEKGGLTVYENNYLLKGDMEKAKDNSKRTRPFTQKTINRLKEHLTEYDKEWIKAAHIQFTAISQDATNEVSMKLKGVPLAIAKNYIRLYVDDNFVNTESSAVKVDATLEGQGRLKSTTNNSPQPLRIMGIENVVNDNINETAKYYAYAVPIRNLRKALNVTLPGGEKSVAQTIQDKYGSETLKKLVRIIDEVETGRAITSGKEGDEFQKDFGELYSNFISAVLNTNISVSIKQFASYPTAMAYIDAKNLTKALGARVNLDEIDNYTGAHYKRRLGLSHMELDIIKSNSKLQDVIEKLPKVLNGRSWITTVDCFTTAKLWLASKYQINDEIKGTQIKQGSEEYWEKVTDLYHTVLEDTQPMYDVQYRTGIQKSNDPLAKVLSMLKTQPLQTFGMIYDSHGELKAASEAFKKNSTADNKAKLKRAKRRFVGGAVPALITSALLLSLLTLSANFVLNKTSQWRDEKTGELDILSHFPQTIMNSLISMIAPIGGSEIYSMLTGDFYDLEVPTLAMINDAYDSVNKAYNYAIKVNKGEKELSVKDLRKYLGNIAFDTSALLGIETKNIVNMLEAGTYYIGGKVLGNKQIENSLGYQYKDSQLYMQFVNAVESGNAEKEKAVKEKLIDRDKTFSQIDSGIATKLIENEPLVKDAANAFIKADYETYEDIIGDIASRGYKSDVVQAAVDRVINSLTETEEKANENLDGEKSLYDSKDLYEAMIRGDSEGFNRINEYLVNREKDTETAIKTNLKKGVMEGQMSMDKAKSYMREYLGYDNYKLYKVECTWRDISKYDELAEAVRTGDYDDSKRLMELLYNRGKGEKVESIKKGIGQKLKGEYIYQYYSGGNTNQLKSRILTAMDYLGVDIEKYAESMDKWKSSSDCYDDMNYYIAAGNIQNAQNEIYDLYYNQDKKKDTILKSIMSTYKPLYLYLKGSGKDTSGLKRTLLAMAVYLGENKDDYSERIDEWK